MWTLEFRRREIGDGVALVEDDLVGRADSRGLGPYNIALGERRADTVRDYLSTLGVNGAKLTARSRGKLDATGTEEIGWKRDRRVDVMLP